jgi:ribosomal protein S18 acetylase RimI-like enzyme
LPFGQNDRTGQVAYLSHNRRKVASHAAAPQPFKPKVESSILFGRIPWLFRGACRLAPNGSCETRAMQIRPAVPGEAHDVSALVQRAYGHYVARIGRRPGPMDDDYAEKVARGLVSVADEAGEIVGLIVLLRQPGHLLVENVAVAPERQGEGVGRDLLAFAEAVAREAGTPVLRLYTHAAMTENLALYPRLGYEQTDRRTDNGFERVFFVKRL